MKSRSHLFVAGTAWASRIVLALLQVASVRLLTVGLGHEAYAVYALLLGMAAWFTLADFGISSALQNLISESRARGHNYAPAIGIWATIAVGLGALLSVAAWFLSPWLSKFLMANFTGISSNVKITSLRIMAIASIALASSSLIYKVWYGEHRGHLTHICQLLSGLLAYCCTAMILRSEVTHRLEWSLIAYFGFSAVLPATFLLFRTKGLRCPRSALWSAETKAFGKRAAGFWGYGLMAALVLQLDYALISSLLGPNDVVAYSIYARVFGLGFFVYTSVLNALWPLLSEKATQGRSAEMMRTVLRHVIFGLAFIVLFTSFVILFEAQILNLISPTLHVTVSATFVPAMGAYYFIRVWSDTFAVMLQSMGQLRAFYIMVPTQAAVSIVGQIAGSYWLGLSGIPVGMGLSFLLTVAWAAPLLSRTHSLRIAEPS